MVSLMVAILFFWLAPKRQRRRDLAIELWTMYNSDEMKTSRRDAWAYFHGETDVTVVNARIEKFWKWAIELGPQPEFKADAPQLQQVQKVFDFFATCDACLRNEDVDKRLLKASIGYYFSRWSHDTIEALVRSNAPPQLLRDATLRPAWLLGMPTFRKLMGMQPPLTIQGA